MIVVVVHVSITVSRLLRARHIVVVRLVVIVVVIVVVIIVVVVVLAEANSVTIVVWSELGFVWTTIVHSLAFTELFVGRLTIRQARIVKERL